MDWDKLRTDFEGLFPEQLKLIVELVEQMKKANQDREGAPPDYRM